MLDLGRRQRTLVADKVFDAANIAAGGMIFGQFLSERPFSPLLALIGLSIWSVFFAVSIVLEGRDE